MIGSQSDVIAIIGDLSRAIRFLEKMDFLHAEYPIQRALETLASKRHKCEMEAQFFRKPFRLKEPTVAADCPANQAGFMLTAPARQPKVKDEIWVCYELDVPRVKAIVKVICLEEDEMLAIDGPPEIPLRLRIEGDYNLRWFWSETGR